MKSISIINMGWVSHFTCQLSILNFRDLIINRFVLAKATRWREKPNSAILSLCHRIAVYQKKKRKNIFMSHRTAQLIPRGIYWNKNSEQACLTASTVFWFSWLNEEQFVPIDESGWDLCSISSGRAYINWMPGFWGQLSFFLNCSLNRSQSRWKRPVWQDSLT